MFAILGLLTFHINFRAVCRYPQNNLLGLWLRSTESIDQGGQNWHCDNIETYCVFSPKLSPGRWETRLEYTEAQGRLPCGAGKETTSHSARHARWSSGTGHWDEERHQTLTHLGIRQCGARCFPRWAVQTPILRRDGLVSGKTLWERYFWEGNWTGGLVWAKLSGWLGGCIDRLIHWFICSLIHGINIDWVSGAQGSSRQHVQLPPAVQAGQPCISFLMGW